MTGKDAYTVRLARSPSEIRACQALRYRVFYEELSARPDSQTAASRLDPSLAYDAELEKKIAALTPDDVLAALKKHFDPRRLVIVIAGDFGKSPQ